MSRTYASSRAFHAIDFKTLTASIEQSLMQNNFDDAQLTIKYAFEDFERKLREEIISDIRFLFDKTK